MTLCLAAWLRWHDAGESLWLDELHTAWCAEGTLADVAPRAALGNQSPLYFYAEWCLTSLFGQSELSLRLMSLLCGIALPAAIYFMTRAWTAAAESETSAICGLVAAALATVDPLSIFYAQEARPYAAVQLLAVGHLFLLTEWLREQKLWQRIAWILSGVLLFYLHYTTALVFVPEAVFLSGYFCFHRSTKRPLAVLWLINFALLALLCLPALSQLRDIASRRENWDAFIQPQPAVTILTVFPWSIASLYLAVAFLTNPTRQRGSSSLALRVSDETSLALRVGDEASLARLVSDETSLTRSVRYVVLLLCWLFIPVTLAWLATEAGVARLFLPRYLIASLAPSYIVAALCVPLMPTRSGRILFALALVGTAIFTSGIVQQLRHDGRVHGQRREDWRGAVTFLNFQLEHRPLPVLVRSGLIEADAVQMQNNPQLRDYCLYPVTSLYRLNVPREVLIPLPTVAAGQLSPEVKRLVQARGGTWLLLRANEASARRIERECIQSLSDRDTRAAVIHRQAFGNLWVVQVSAAPLP